MSGPAGAVEFHIQSETIGDAYQLLTSDNEVLNRHRLHQYVGFAAYDLLGDGEHQLSVSTLLRFDADFGIKRSELDQVETLKREQLSIQYAVVEGRGLFNGWLDFQVGRQLVPDPLDYLLLDGARITIKTPYYFGVELLAGVEAANDLGPVTASQFELDGVRVMDDPLQKTDRPKVVLGAALVTNGLWNTRARVGYRRIFSAGKVVQEKVGASVYQRLFERLHLHGSFSFDLYTEEADAIRASVRGQVTDWLSAEIEYVHLVPTFDADSIFNIFYRSQLNDINTRVRLHTARSSWAYAGGMVRLLGNESVDTVDGEVADLVTAWGVMAGYTHGFGMDGRVSADFSLEDGFGGRRMLVDLSGRWSVLPGTVDLDGRLTSVVFEDAVQERLRAFSFGYQLGARYMIDRRAALQLVVEHNINRLQNTQLRVILMADVNLWL